MLAASLAFALSGQSSSKAERSPSTPCNVTVHVLEATTGKPLSAVAVNLRLGSNNPQVVQQETDSCGATCFSVSPTERRHVSIDAFSLRYHSVQADAAIHRLPAEVTVPMRRMSWWERVQFFLQGD